MEHSNISIDVKTAAARIRANNPNFEDLAGILARRYKIKNPAGLTELLRDIKRGPEVPMPAKERSPALNEIANPWSIMQKQAKRIIDTDRLFRNKGHAHALLRIRSAQWGEKVVEALNVIADTPTRRQVLTDRRSCSTNGHPSGWRARSVSARLLPAQPRNKR